MEPVHALLGSGNNDHFLLFKLMNAVNASFLNAVSTLFLTEAGRIACEGVGESFLVNDGINIFSYHGMLTCAYEIKVLALNLVHHGIHFRKAHNACNNAASYHKWGNAVGKALFYHKITGI